LCKTTCDPGFDGEVRLFFKKQILFSECTSGTYCSQSFLPVIAGAGCAGYCLPLSSAGGTCDPYSLCAPGLVCQLGGFLDTGLCQALVAGQR
jgi:hypothetical protein